MIDGQNDGLLIDVGYFPQLQVIAFGLFLAVDEFCAAIVGSRPRDAARRPDHPYDDEEERVDEEAMKRMNLALRYSADRRSRAR